MDSGYESKASSKVLHLTFRTMGFPKPSEASVNYNLRRQVRRFLRKSFFTAVCNLHDPLAERYAQPID